MPWVPFYVALSVKTVAPLRRSCHATLPQKAIVVFRASLSSLSYQRTLDGLVIFWAAENNSDKSFLFCFFFQMHLPDFRRTIKLLFKAPFWLHFAVLNSQLCQIPNSWLSHFTFRGLWIVAAITGRSNECLWRLGTIYQISGGFLFRSHAFYDLSSELHCSLGNKQKVTMRYKPTPVHEHRGIYC